MPSAISVRAARACRPPGADRLLIAQLRDHGNDVPDAELAAQPRTACSSGRSAASSSLAFDGESVARPRRALVSVDPRARRPRRLARRALRAARAARCRHRRRAAGGAALPTARAAGALAVDLESKPATSASPRSIGAAGFAPLPRQHWALRLAAAADAGAGAAAPARCRRLLLRRGALRDRRRAGRRLPLPLRALPAQQRRAGGDLAHRAAAGAAPAQRHAARTPLDRPRACALLRRLRHRAHASARRPSPTPIDVTVASLDHPERGRPARAHLDRAARCRGCGWTTICRGTRTCARRSPLPVVATPRPARTVHVTPESPLGECRRAPSTGVTRLNPRTGAGALSAAARGGHAGTRAPAG